MNDAANDVLELGRVREALADRAQTPHGKARALALVAWTEPDAVRHNLALTTEARRLHDEQALVDLGDCPDIESILSTLAVDGRALAVEDLVSLAGFCAVATETRRALVERETELPLVGELGGRIPALEPVRARILRVIDLEAEDVRDDASDALSKLRTSLARVKKRLTRVIDQTLASRDNAKILQEAIVTTRNGRSVVPIKAECKPQFPGIVHGASSSGATVFVEPSGAVELGNELAALTDREQQEVRRILTALAAELAPERKHLLEASHLAAEIDFVQAKGRLSASYRATAPRLSDADLRLVDVRHPLVPNAVPVSFHLANGRRGLVFTGPNTGGKTVGLKTAGLVCLMAQAGLHIPASSASELPVFRTVFADIGDDQSIASSLSTFSAHLSKVVAMERELALPALVILDEVGTGTDPSEGGALGTAIVESLLARGAHVLASTHHGLLKAYASTTDGIDTASFQFDPDTYAPTYEIVEGAAGRSLAFEMAARLGLSKAVVDRARALQSERERQVGELVERLEADSAELERQKAKVERERSLAAEARERLEKEARDERSERAKRLSEFQDKLKAEVSETKQELRSLLAEAKQARREQRLRLDELEQTLSERLERATAPSLARAASEVRELVPEPALPTESKDVGARVLVAAFGVEGRITRIVSDTEAEVLVHDKKLRLALSELEPLPAEPPADRVDRQGRRPRVAPEYALELKETPSELNVIGCTVEEALDRADKFLDDAFLSDHREVKLIHGHGKGRLKSAIREWLTGHPHVARQKSENRGGVTIVELKD